MNLDELVQEIDDIRREFERVKETDNFTREELDRIRSKFIGKKGRITLLFKHFPQLPPPERKEAGRLINPLKKEIEGALKEFERRIFAGASRRREFLDISLPGKKISNGHLHPISRTLQDIYKIFRRLGFTVATGPEVETDYYNFEALNFPDNHPARDMQDTFYITADKSILLRTHTSPVQIRYMRSRGKPPVRAIFPGRVYRNEAISPRSYCVFHQVEGLYVDRNVSFAELKGTLELFCKQFFGSSVKLRFRPSFFPFTEPSAEVDISCFICSGKGCRICKYTGWLEILGCGMVDPNLYQHVGFDPDKYTGYAFGMGVERIALLKYGVDDIRYLFDGDLRFLGQF